MAHITTVPRESLPELEPLFQAVEAGMGFVPNSMLTMAHWPELLQSFAGFAGTILNSGQVDPGLKQLIAFVSSNASGCRYCQAHTSQNATRQGVDEAKVEIMSVIALFGFLNRWNDTMATTLEDEPAAFARNALKPKGWAPGKHE